MGWLRRLLSGKEKEPRQTPVASQSPQEWAAARAAEREHLTANSAYARAQAQREATGKPIPRESKGPRPAPHQRKQGVIYRSDYLSPEREENYSHSLTMGCLRLPRDVGEATRHHTGQEAGRDGEPKEQQALQARNLLLQRAWHE